MPNRVSLHHGGPPVVAFAATLVPNRLAPLSGGFLLVPMQRQRWRLVS
jgi:hypothetical protein